MLNLIFAVLILLATIPFSGHCDQSVYEVSAAGKKNAEYLKDSAMFIYHLKKNNEEKAQNFLISALENNPHSHYFSYLLTESFRRGSIAKEKYLEIVRKHPESAVLNHFAVIQLLEKNEKELAFSMLKRAISYRLDPPEDGVPPRGISKQENSREIQDLFVLQMALLQNDKKYEEANRFLQRVELICSIEPSDSCLLALIEYHLRAVPEAKTDYNKTSFRKYVDILKKRLDSPNHFKEEISPEFLLLLFGAGETELAEAICIEPLLNAPTTQIPYQNLQRWFILKNSPWNALRCNFLEQSINKIQRKRPEPELFLSRLKLLLATKDQEAIRNEALHLLSINMMNDHLLSSVTEFFLQKNDIKTAEFFLKKIKNKAIIELLLPFLLKQQKKYKPALQIFLKLERTFPESELYKFMAAETAAAAGENEIEEQFIKEMQLKSSGNPDFQNYLSYRWARKGINLDQAETYVRAALKTDPENYAYLDTLAWVLYQKKEYQKAKTEILKAIDQCGNEVQSGELFDHAGDIFYALGDVDTAKRYWQKAVQTNDPELDLKKVLNKLPKPVIQDELQKAQTQGSKEDDPKTVPQEP